MANELVIRIPIDVTGLPDLKSVSGELDKVGTSAGKLDQVSTGAFERIGHRITDLGVSLISSGIQMGIEKIGEAIGLASDKAEASNKAMILFGDGFDTVKEASEGAATAVGLSSGAYLSLAGDLGNLTTNLGFTGEEAAGMSVDMLQLAADMGSFNNASTEDVVTAMGAAFRGESEPIRAFGVFLDDARVKAKALELGLYDGEGALDANAKAAATYQLIIEQTTAAQGDFAETSTGLANSQKIGAAQMEESWTSIGEALMPLAVEIMPLITDAIRQLIDGILPMVQRLSAWVLENKDLIDTIIGLAVTLTQIMMKPLELLLGAITWIVTAIRDWVDAHPEVIAVLGKLGEIVGQIAAAIQGLLQRALDVIIGVLGTVFDVVGKVAGALSGPLKAGVGLVAGAFDLLKGPVDIVIGLAKLAWDVFTKLAGLFRGPVDVAIGILKTAFDVLVKGIQAGADIIGRVLGAVQDVFQTLQRIAQDVLKAIGTAWNTLWTGIQRIGGQIMDFVGKIFQPLADAINDVMAVVKNAWNSFARAWNGFQINIPKIEIPNPLGGFFTLGGGSIGLPKLPTLARGGIVTAPTLLIAGERGAEAIVPLERGGFGGQVINVYVEAGVGDPVAIGREIVETIRAYERANGPAF